MSGRQRLRALAIVLSGALAIAACGGGDDDTAAGGDREQTATTVVTFGDDVEAEGPADDRERSTSTTRPGGSASTEPDENGEHDTATTTTGGGPSTTAAPSSTTAPPTTTSAPPTTTTTTAPPTTTTTAPPTTTTTVPPTTTTTAPPSGPQNGTRDTGCEADQRARINQARANVGQPPLSNDPGIQHVPLDWSDHMAGTQTLAHNPNYAGQIAAVRNYGYAGENVGRGPGSEVIFNAFMNSTGHRKNIEKPEYTHVAVGCVRDAGNQLWITQNFWG